MDHHRFDIVARSLGTVRSRRDALGLVAGTVGIALSAAVADARTGKHRKPRGKGKAKRKPARPAAVSAVCTAAGSKSCAVAQAKPGAVLKDCDYSAADLSGTALNAANLSKVSLAGADLAGANLAGANLANACLTGADLRGASLRGASLTGADLTGANLSGVDLRGSNVKPAQLEAAVVSCGTVLPSGKKATCPLGTTCEAGACVNWQGTCQTGLDTCATRAMYVCNGNRTCSCFTSTEGTTRCGLASLGNPSVCGQCQSTADCVAAFPADPGVFCARTVGTAFCCGGTGAGFCIRGCPPLS